MKKILCGLLSVCLMFTSIFVVDLSSAEAKSVDKAQEKVFSVQNEEKLKAEKSVSKSKSSRTIHTSKYFTLAKRGYIDFEVDKLVDEYYDDIECEFSIYDKNGTLQWRTSNFWQVDNGAYYYRNRVGLNAGTYYLEVNDFSYVSDTISWGYDIVYDSHYETEPNNIYEDYLPLNTTYRGNLEEGSSYDSDMEFGIDSFKFKLEKGKKYRVLLGNFDDIYYYGDVLLMNPKNNVFMKTDDFELHEDSNGNAYVSFEAAYTGYYYLALANYDSEEFQYSIKVVTEAAPTKIYSRLSTSKGGYDDIYTYWSKASGASGYYVYYRKLNNSKWTYLTRTTSTSILKKNLVDGGKYQFKVVPYYYINGSRFKSLKYRISPSVITLKKVSTPSVYKYSSTKTKVRWNNIYGESGYQISRSTSKTGTYIVSTYGTTRGTYKVLNTRKNRSYYYKVRAYKNVTKNGKTYRVYGPWSNAKYYKLR